MQTILNAEARRTQYTFMMCEKLVVSFVCCSSAGPDSRKRNGCCANDGQLFTQRNSLYRMQIGGQLKMRNDKIDARDESVRRVCIDTSCTMNWKWHVVYIHLYIGRYIYIFFMTIERNHHKAVITIKQAKKHMHTNCYPLLYAVACRTHRVGGEICIRFEIHQCKREDYSNGWDKIFFCCVLPECVVRFWRRTW